MTIRKIISSKRLRWLFVVLVQFVLAACALGGNMVMHSFSFDALVDSPGIEVLDYQYGSSHQHATYADRARVAMGQVFPEENTYGAMPRGDFLYVKWRIKKTGKVYEDRIDLSHRLPADITNYGIHFVIQGSQLYVYLIPPPGEWPSLVIQKAASDERYSAWLKQHQIYPDQPQ